MWVNMLYTYTFIYTVYILGKKKKLAVDIFCILYIALHEYSVCILIKLDIFTYSTLYKELGDNMVTFCNEIIKKQTVEFCYIMYIPLCMWMNLDLIYTLLYI